jgi:hypothetical protein
VEGSDMRLPVVSRQWSVVSRQSPASLTAGH